MFDSEGPRAALLVSAWNQAVAELRDDNEGPESLIISSDIRRMSHFFLNQAPDDSSWGDFDDHGPARKESTLPDADMLGPWWFECPTGESEEVQGLPHPEFPSRNSAEALRNLLWVLNRCI